MDAREVVIREARAEDAAWVIAFIQQMTDELGIGVVTSPGEFNLTVEQEERFITEHAESDNSILLVGDANGEIVAVANCTGGQRKANRHNCVLAISVAKEWRDRGLGTAIMQRLLDWARQSNIITRVELEVFAHNDRAIHVYEKLGFQHEGRRRKAFIKEGLYIDSLVMAVLLDDGEAT
jgi:RimJ/RimL family protein N-acetyltransferase